MLLLVIATHLQTGEALTKEAQRRTGERLDDLNRFLDRHVDEMWKAPGTVDLVPDVDTLFRIKRAVDRAAIADTFIRRRTRMLEVARLLAVLEIVLGVGAAAALFLFLDRGAFVAYGPWAAGVGLGAGSVLLLYAVWLGVQVTGGRPGE